jgi:ubiquinone/menaquinone biosynthesis C-methylase UbiE
MVLTTDIDLQPEDVADFYDRLAPDYDLMTGFEKRFESERPHFERLVRGYAIRSALDAGCGTGFHALLLSQLGVRVTAVDVSEGMLERLKAHAQRKGLNISVVHSVFQDLPAGMSSQFDALFCLGNTLAHLTAEDALSQSLRAFHRVLRPGGVLFLQNLNFERILANNERIQSVKEVGGTTYVRFYDFAGDQVLFNIAKIMRSDQGLRQDLTTVELRPLSRGDLLRALDEARFVRATTYGGISLEPFHVESSRDLVAVATKPVSPTPS